MNWKDRIVIVPKGLVGRPLIKPPLVTASANSMQSVLVLERRANYSFQEKEIG